MDQEEMYNKLAKYTDLLYHDKDYEKEAKFILRRIKNHKNKNLIDVACGSGNHSKFFQKKGWKVYAVDLNKGMLRLAKKNIPKAKIFRQDMKKLNLKIRASVLICMFNSINYNFGYKQLRSTLKRFHNHLDKEGVLVFDSFLLTESDWLEGHFSVDEYKSKNLNFARINRAIRQKDVATMEQTYVVYEKNKKSVYESENKRFLLDRSKVLNLMKEVGFKARVYYDFSDSKKTGKYPVFVGIKE